MLKKTLKKTIRPILRPILYVLCKVLFRVEVKSANPNFNVPRLIIVANHESFLDGLLLGLFLPINPIFVVNTHVSRVSVFRFILSMVDYITVDPTNPIATRQIMQLVESGRPVVIFPEGRITLTGSLMKVYEGTAFVAGKTGATIIPVRLDGPQRTYFSRMRGHASPRGLFPKMRITILPPTRIEMSELRHAKDRRHYMAESMRRIMQEMLFATRTSGTIFEGLLAAANIHGRKKRVVEDIRQIEYTYADMIKMALMLGRLSRRLDEPGARIGVLLPNLAPTLALIIGLSAFRRVPAMLNFTSGTEGMQSACIAAGIKTIITSRAFLEQGSLSEKIKDLKNIRIVYLEDLRQQITWRDKLWWIGFARWFPQDAPNAVYEPEEIAVVLFTSGSEGKPKGVALSHRALLSNIAQARAVIDIMSEDKFLNSLPLFHSFGLTAGALLPLMTGCSLFLYPTPLHYRVIPELAYDRACSVMFGTSTFLEHYGKFAHPYDFYRLRYVIAGAERLTQEVREMWFEKFGIRIFEGYGATETAPVLAVNTPMAYRSGTVGQLLPGVRHRVVPVEGIDQGGILHVSGPNVMSGYYRFENPGVLEPPESSIGPGWYDTGDVVEMDEEGFVRIVGRVKRFAKIAGEMISLEMVENMARASSPVKQHAAINLPDAQRGESIILYTTDTELTRDQLRETAKTQGIPELAIPRKIVSLPEMPLLGSGKTDYVALKEIAEKE
ncbi:MAG: bifunctional acyl-ACP--phospholipid O-acyltransferase/long-chain-fatty-acid--ACP ligase [Oxalobacter sp.]|nr:MAG: bifunctional acyl-ACP--phospholipid O-acyltransferase/long-chain-fatty-acid--ACP ligase [Oxalobacter sp.]